MKKIVFLDVDGTLTMQNGFVPKSTIKAIKLSRENGTDIYLCTGRSMSEITEDIHSIGFDGYIAAGGSYIEINETVVHHQLMKEEDIKTITEYLNENKIGYYLESNEGLFPNDYIFENIKKSVDYLVKTKPNLFVDINEPYPDWFTEILKEYVDKKVPLNKINKLSFVSIDHPFEEVFKTFKDKFEIYHSTVFEFGDESGEIGLKGIDKNIAINKVLETYDENIFTYAYGDGLNDIPMFKAVDYSIAMKNGADELKNIADEIIDIAETDSIYKSFKDKNLI